MAIHIPVGQERQAAIDHTYGLTKSDARRFRLYSVCLRKRHDSMGFDVTKRYRRLQDFYQGIGFSPEAAWIRDRLGFIRKGAGP